MICRTARRVAPLLLVLLSACKDTPDRHLRLGNWYYEKGLADDAVLEYREAIRLTAGDPRSLSREELATAMKAHYNLSIAYSKKGWHEYALKEAEAAFELWPSKDHFEMVELLRKRRALEKLDIDTGS